MKTIKVYIEGGVCTDVVIPKEFHNKLNYEVIDYDHIEAEEDKKNAEKNKKTIWSMGYNKIQFQII